MRYAIIRGGKGLPSPDVQRQSFADLPYDVALEEVAASGRSQRWIVDRLLQLGRGDEILVWSLDVLLLSTAELVTVLARLWAAGVTVRLTRSSVPETLKPLGDVPLVLSLLAEHERRRPSREPAYRRVRNSGRPLTSYQLRYARQLMRRGTSRREIGLIFQLAPSELTEQLQFDDAACPEQVVDEENMTVKLS